MNQDQSARLRLGHKRYGGVQNDAPKGGMFICDKCGGIDRVSVMTKIGGQEICETCVDQYLIKSAANDKEEAWRPQEKEQ